MKKLWAPWRMEYILSPKDKGCFLCRAWKEGENGKNYVLFRGSAAFILMNTYPYNNGHLMVSTAEHLGSLEETTGDIRSEMMELVNDSIIVLKKAIAPHGFNVGINLGSEGGAGLTDHLHIHIVPRWQGDTNYMPIIGSTKVISEHLDDTYLKIKAYFK